MCNYQEVCAVKDEKQDISLLWPEGKLLRYLQTWYFSTLVARCLGGCTCLDQEYCESNMMTLVLCKRGGWHVVGNSISNMNVIVTLSEWDWNCHH